MRSSQLITHFTGLFERSWRSRHRLIFNRETARILIACSGALVFGAAGHAQDNAEIQPPPSLATLQRQLDELKQGQQAILKELAEIKKSLPEKPIRADSLTRPQLPPLVSLNVHGESYRGDSKAKVAMIEYSDFDCSFCARYANDIYPQIEREYIQTGKIRYFFRDLPAPGETNALLKAELARCAGEQGKFWEMHDLLFKTPSAPVAPDQLLQGQALGLDIQKLKECLSSGKHQASIQRSASSAARLGIVGTPAFLLGTLSEDGDFVRATNVLVGAENHTTLSSILDNLLGTGPKH